MKRSPSLRDRLVAAVFAAALASCRHHPVPPPPAPEATMRVMEKNSDGTVVKEWLIDPSTLRDETFPHHRISFVDPATGRRVTLTETYAFE